MTRRPDSPALYEVRLEGHLDEHWSTWFDGMAVTRADDGTTTLRGLLVDQAALHGLLAKVRDLGARLMSVEVVPDRVLRLPAPPPALRRRRSRIDQVGDLP